jgi:hypothetical protein
MSNRWSPKPCWRRAAVLASFLALLTSPVARAQIALPGAVAPAEEGSVAVGGQGESASKPAKKKRPKVSAEDGAAGPAIAPKPPTEESASGKPLYLDGTRSAIELQRSGGEFQVAKLTLTGDRIARSGETCRVDVAGMPLKLTQRESESGLRHYQIEFPACPFSFDVLDGAILVSNQGGACELKAADCRADPTGLWGVGGGELTDPKRAKEMLNQRARTEKTVRADFQSLYAKNKKDKIVRKLLVREQAGFSSHREEICRSYAQESDFGYCALRVTEARALTLGTQLAKGVKLPANIASEEEAPPRKGGKGKK